MTQMQLIRTTPERPVTPPLPFPVWSRVRHTLIDLTGTVRAAQVDRAGAWWVLVEADHGSTEPGRWVLASLCEAA